MIRLSDGTKVVTPSDKVAERLDKIIGYFREDGISEDEITKWKQGDTNNLKNRKRMQLIIEAVDADTAKHYGFDVMWTKIKGKDTAYCVEGCAAWFTAEEADAYVEYWNANPTKTIFCDKFGNTIQ